MGDVIIKMFVMFISNNVKCSSARGSPGQHNIWYIFGCCSKSHLLKKKGWGLPDLGGLVSASRCYAGLGWYISNGWCLWSLWCMHYRFPWSMLQEQLGLVGLLLEQQVQLLGLLVLVSLEAFQVSTQV